jgi:dUTP pyrophosphatase
MNKVSFNVFRQHKDAVIPKRSDVGAAGYDLVSVEDHVIQPHSQAIVDTGIVLDFPSECYARVAPRSGLAAKYSIDTLAGVIDSSYRGTVKVILYNHSDKEFVVTKGDRIAQLIYESIYTPSLVEVPSFADLTETDRGDGGFGSTGIN